MQSVQERCKQRLFQTKSLVEPAIDAQCRKNAANGKAATVIVYVVHRKAMDVFMGLIWSMMPHSNSFMESQTFFKVPTTELVSGTKVIGLSLSLFAN
jgi:hypothetical protein